MSFKHLHLDNLNEVDGLRQIIQPNKGAEVEYDRSILECCKQKGVPKFCYGFCKGRKLLETTGRSAELQHCVAYAPIFKMCVLGCKCKSF